MFIFGTLQGGITSEWSCNHDFFYIFNVMNARQHTGFFFIQVMVTIFYLSPFYDKVCNLSLQYTLFLFLIRLSRNDDVGQSTTLVLTKISVEGITMKICSHIHAA